MTVKLQRTTFFLCVPVSQSESKELVELEGHFLSGKFLKKKNGIPRHLKLNTLVTELVELQISYVFYIPFPNYKLLPQLKGNYSPSQHAILSDISYSSFVVLAVRNSDEKVSRSYELYRRRYSASKIWIIGFWNFCYSM